MLEQVVLTIAQGMVHGCAARLGGHVWHTDEVKHWQMLGVGAGDTVERTEFANPVCRTECSRTLDTRIAIGGVGGVEFVAAAHPVHLRTIADGIVYRERVV